MCGVEIDYAEIEPGVREIVRFFNEHGLPTVASCEGHDRGSHLLWVGFDQSVNSGQIIHFQSQYMNDYGEFMGEGLFFKECRVQYWKPAGGQEGWHVVKCWKYCTGCKESAERDVACWRAVDAAREQLKDN